MRNVAVLPAIKSKVRMALMSLTAFQEISTQDLIASARSLPGGTKVHIPDRATSPTKIPGQRVAKGSRNGHEQDERAVSRTMHMVIALTTRKIRESVSSRSPAQ
jgi:hypothetical protein